MGKADWSLCGWGVSIREVEDNSEVGHRWGYG